MRRPHTTVGRPRLRSCALICLVALTACEQQQGASGRTATQDLMVADVKEPGAPSSADAKAPPQIAYSYTLAYRLDASAIAPVQAAHVALCDKLGAAHCRVEHSTATAATDDYATNELALLVDAGAVRTFNADLDASVAKAGGEATRHEVAGEDLSKAMIDVGARIGAKQALADRLLVLLRTKTGGVADLVAAERAYADVQGELDAARAQMADMQGRVAQSKLAISYQSREASGHGFVRPVSQAARYAGETLGGSLGALLTFAFAALPWILVVAGLLWLKRRLGWRVRWPWRRKARDEA